MTDPQRPDHHAPDGRFRNPWPGLTSPPGPGRILRWQWERMRDGRVPNPEPGAIPRADPALARPRAPEGEARVTWVGHATFLLQLPALTLLTDPVWARRASPLPWLGPARLVPPAPAFEDLPPVDAVLLSHDHYDHLDRPTVQALHERFGADLTWITPLGFRGWFHALGIRRVEELDWWTDVDLPGGGYRAVCLPARHWTRRTPGGTNRRLWASWAVVPVLDPGGIRIYFGGDSGYHPAYERIGAEIGPFDASLLPIGAYDPRWFMEPAHMNPEEAVQAYRDLGARGAFVAAHWGTFRLTDEPPLEPPERVREAWRHVGLPEGDLHVLRHGETLRLATPPRSTPSP